MKFSLNFTAGIMILTVSAHTAIALSINPTWDSSVINLSNAAQWESGFQAAIEEFQNLITDPITVNITFKASPGTSIFGQSHYTVHNTYSFAQVVAALHSHAMSADDNSSAANLTTDPTHSGRFVFNDAQSKALGFRSPTDAATDGNVTIGTGFNFAFDPSNRAIAGKYDFIGVVEHEISEVLGRAQGLGTSYGSGQYAAVYQPFDLFRYRGLNLQSINSTDTNVYFSIDRGATNLRNYNSVAGRDLQDWKGTSPYTPDAFNETSFSGFRNGITAADITTMDVIGYTVPEPGSGMLLVTSAVLLALRRQPCS